MLFLYLVYLLSGPTLETLAPINQARNPRETFTKAIEAG